MDHFQIELLPDGEAKFTEQKKKHPGALQTLIRTTFYTLVFLLVGVSIFTYRIASLDTSVSGHGKPVNLITHVKNFIGFGDGVIQGAPTDRINILLLGKGGFGHEGPHLTDTIILVSIKPSTEDIALVSIPRDLLVWQDQYQWRKINHANSFGEELKPGHGGEFASKVIGRAIQQPIHYYITVDFNGLVQIVDILGGLEVDVPNSFTDSSYPTDDFLTQTISFEEGRQTMDGEQVLQFVRSRHGTNGEGNDFARARRQQLVLESLKDQVLNLGIIFKPTKINALLKAVNQNVQTNLHDEEISTFAGLINQFEDTEVTRLVLDDSPQGLLRSLITNEGAYVLTPRHGSFSEIAFLIEHVFTAVENRPEPLRVAVRNGTLITGLANIASDLLTLNGIYVTEIENAERKDWEETGIYKITGNADDTQLSWLQQNFGGNISLGVPEWLEVSDEVHTATTTKKTIPESDVLLILGSNAERILQP